jgi:hypothetical protein
MVDVLGQTLDLINKGGVVALLLFAVWALASQRVVPGSVHKDDQARIKELEFRLDRQLSTTDTAINAAEKVANVATRGRRREGE